MNEKLKYPIKKLGIKVLYDKSRNSIYSFGLVCLSLPVREVSNIPLILTSLFCVYNVERLISLIINKEIDSGIYYFDKMNKYKLFEKTKPIIHNWQDWGK